MAPAAAVRIIFWAVAFGLDAALEPAGKFPKTFDQGLGTFGLGHPGLDIGVAGFGDELRQSPGAASLSVPTAQRLWAVAEALRLPDSYFTGLRGDLCGKRDLLSAGLAEAGFEVYRPAGTFFVTTDVRPLGYADGMEFCRELPHRAGVVAIPSSVFYDNVEAARSRERPRQCSETATQVTCTFCTSASLRNRNSGRRML